MTRTKAAETTVTPNGVTYRVLRKVKQLERCASCNATAARETGNKEAGQR